MSTRTIRRPSRSTARRGALPGPPAVDPSPRGDEPAQARLSVLRQPTPRFGASVRSAGLGLTAQRQALPCHCAGDPRHSRRDLQGRDPRRRVSASPCENTKLPKKQPKEIVPLDTAAIDALRTAIPERYQALVVLAAGTACARASASASPSTASTSCVHVVWTASSCCCHASRPSWPAQDVGLAPHHPASARRRQRARRAHPPLPRQPPGRLGVHRRRRRGPTANRLLRYVWRPTIKKIPGIPTTTGMHDLRHITRRC